jgi:hypothetical protein
MWSPLPKTQRRIKMLCHSPCKDTPYAANVAVTTCGVSLLSSKNIVFVSTNHIAIHGRSNTLPVVTATVAALGVSSLGLYKLIKYWS